MSGHYGDDRERRRRGSVLRWGLYLVAAVVSLAARVGVLAAAITLVAVVGVDVGVVTLVQRRRKRREQSRRLAGVDPSWPAQMPLHSAGTHGAGPSTPRRAAEVTGRLSYHDGVFTWTPSPLAEKNLGAVTHSWDGSWVASLEPLAGPFQQGHLVLSHPDGQTADLWLRNSDDFLALTTHTHHDQTT